MASSYPCSGCTALSLFFLSLSTFSFYSHMQPDACLISFSHMHTISGYRLLCLEVPVLFICTCGCMYVYMWMYVHVQVLAQKKNSDCFFFFFSPFLVSTVQVCLLRRSSNPAKLPKTALHKHWLLLWMR